MGETITFTAKVNEKGEVIVTFPEGPGQQRDAAKVASLTEQLGKLAGRITERHKGAHHDHDHDHHHHHVGEE